MPSASAETTLLVTNDYPPRFGGIETFVSAVTEMLDDDVVVLTSSHPGAGRVRVPHPVHRAPTPVLLPTPATTRYVADQLRRTGATRVLFGAAAPLALMAGRLRQAGARRVVALSHGHEATWARLPAGRRALRQIGAQVDHLCYVSEHTRRAIVPALDPAAAGAMVRLPPPVRTDLFRPGPREPSGRLRVLAVARMVRRKGVDTLLRAWRLVLGEFPGAQRPELVLVGDGPRRAGWQRQVRRELGANSGVRWLGAVEHSRVPELMRGADVFALPIRSELAGWSAEGLGVVQVEAAASGLPVLVGRSGGTPETVVDGVSGYLLDPDDPRVWADRLLELLADPDRRAAMGARGREHAQRRFSFAADRRVLRGLLGR